MSVRDIPIAVRIEVEDAPYNDAVKKLNDISTLLEKIGLRTSETATKGLENFTTKLREVTGEVESTIKKTEGLTIGGKEIRIDTSEAIKEGDKLKESQEAINKALQNVTSTALSNEQILIRMGQMYRSHNEVLEENKDKFDNIIAAMKDLESRDLTKTDISKALAGDIEVLEQQFGKLDPSIKKIMGSYKEVSEVADATGISFDDLARKQLLNTTMASRLSDMQQVLGRSFGQMTPIMRDVVMRLSAYEQIAKENNRTLEDTVKGFLSSEQSVDSYTASKKRLQEVEAQAAIYSDLDAKAKQVVMDVLKKTDEEARQYEQTLKQQTETADRVRESNRQLSIEYNTARLSMGKLGVAIETVGRSILWLGLSSLFSMMSLARLARNTLTVESSALSLRRAYISLIDTQREYNEIVEVYGRTSEEAIRAGIDLEDATLNIKMAEDRLRGSIEQSIFSFYQWIFGMVPSFISSSILLTSAIWQTFGAKTASNAADIQTVGSMGAASGAMTLHLPIVGSLSIAYWQLATAIAAVTFGLNLAFAALAQAYAASEAEKRIKEMKESVAALEDQLTGHSLVSSLQETERQIVSTFTALSQFSKGVNNIPDIKPQKQVITQVLSRVNIPRIEEQEQIIRQNLISATIPELDNITQIIRQVLIKADYDTPEEATQLIKQEIIKADIPVTEDQIQVIRQRLEEVRIPDIESITQKIIQVLEKAEITRPEDIVQIITQELKKVNIPEVENITQLIQQKLESVYIPPINDIVQLIRQELQTVTIPEIEPIIQNINQRLIEIEPVTMDEINQIIRQELITVNIPDVDDKVQVITQELMKVDIPTIGDITQIVRQELLPVTIPSIGDITQTIKQNLIEVEMPKVEDINQIIRQSLIRVDIPKVDPQHQAIIQHLEAVRIPYVEAQTQIINQNLVKAKIPSVEDQVYNTRQQLILTEIPKIKDQYQTIFQRLSQVDIPSIDPQEQEIIQRLQQVEIPKLDTQIQMIIQQLQAASIPEITDQEQKIVQQLIMTEIPIVKDQIQNINQRLLPFETEPIEPLYQDVIQRSIVADYINPPSLTQDVYQKVETNEMVSSLPELIQTITQVLEPVDIPVISDIKQFITQYLIEATIPDIPDKIQLIKQELVPAEIPNVNDMAANITTTGVGRFESKRELRELRDISSSSKSLDLLRPIRSNTEQLDVLTGIEPVNERLLEVMTEMKNVISAFVDEATKKGTIYVETKDSDVSPFSTSDNKGITQVIISGNKFTVREEADIPKIANEIARITMRKTYTKRGRY